MVMYLLLSGSLAFPQVCFDSAAGWQVKIDTVPLYKHVAVVTEAHDVLDEVGVIHICKGRYWFDVMNIE